MADARRERPESEAWLGLLESALGESEDGAAWRAVVAQPAADRPVKAPLLSAARITVHGRAARKWVRRLLERAARTNGMGGGAGGGGGGGGRRIDGIALLEAAVNQDDARIDALAGADPHAVRVVGQIAALPLLRACARSLASELPATWWEGYCPLCGAWPVLAEYTGLERKRQLRCGRCGMGWAIPMLRCVFCDETDHEHLGYLTPEGSEQMRKVEVCDTCKGYLKGLTTVRPLGTEAILLDDLMTVPLDVAALERGFHRPERRAYALEARITEQRRATLFGLMFGRGKGGKDGRGGM